ncbi:hypothetical protein [Halostreptopolyspora alba]|uniref:Uncharacterized protein n=1 Tax=Halostreptopolyspora alba TaxID=2487137 RepID=A0A3N0E9E6_9ACTN|nr:hypothetical protein EFW17_12380 [Nocardiopsaceae bacterium YIM 96095]
MLSKLRSRRPLALLVGVVIVAMVATGAVGLFDAMLADDSPQRGQEEPPQRERGGPDATTDPEPAPDLDALGDPPEEVSYEDASENCELGECYRVVGVTGDGLGQEETVEAVANHLLDQGWGQVDPSGREPSGVPASETILSDGEVMIQGTPQPHPEAPDADGFVILAHAEAPNQ